MNTGNYGAVVIRFKVKDLLMSNQISLNLIDKNGNKIGNKVGLGEKYLPETISYEDGTWYDMSIPMSEFINASYTSYLIGGIVVETATPTIFWLDDLRLVQKLSWAMPDVSRKVGGFAFGKHWLDLYCQLSTGAYTRKLHVGNDYDDGDGSGRSVQAVARGFVKQNREQIDVLTGESWGYAVVIQHENNLTTSYLHLDKPNLSIGQEVQRGTYLSTTKPISLGSHLHFGVRIADYSSTFSQAGALPEEMCYINNTKYPAFSDRFIDSENMNWWE